MQVLIGRHGSRKWDYSTVWVFWGCTPTDLLGLGDIKSDPQRPCLTRCKSFCFHLGVRFWNLGLQRCFSGYRDKQNMRHVKMSRMNIVLWHRFSSENERTCYFFNGHTWLMTCLCHMSAVMVPDTEEDSMDIYDGLDVDLGSNRGNHTCYVFLYSSARQK